MRIDVVTLFPEFVQQSAALGVIGRAQTRGLLELGTWNPRDYASDAYRRVDERPYGGGPGMVMLIEPLRAALAAAQAAAATPAPVVYLSPQGSRLTQARVAQFAQMPRLLLLCGRYEGVDERLLEHAVDEEISLGDFVLSGGELAAAVVLDAVGRLLPGVLNHSESAAQDSFADGLLDCPHYTRPERDALGDVPQVLLSGDHAAIRRWRLKQALGRTWLRRPDLLAERVLDAEQRQLLDEFRRERLAALG
ncbi:MAG: tRNA (guanosine(37)-N1)-methyltransferase TrmD [Metallibacterium scheffleri]|jgi:tRNA (guanine37-N1)-methyltransferase|uniref:tRNA (guanine-N(1)-)-methyltransferase n=1 Tax=Metallibacterium scheffleri TaxID=993689 RepID=A0A4S3KUW3_9GAMM|nr:tRNA (guanosine(37)-N1)-methyltransferase TrmD [Metallibacterium scheffleri]MBU6405365.1 tRNA (guanosine(37)-N1)-methyltransferase TrmD [Pseudomonadota bacterium]MDE3142097.1 tRNA (guanosine(37)-N1)-methyltransferase TrmD [Pseudomonadota bacterium]THD12094.1 tRNA (guanosine(37)-N1)-methyltransferase TrmD [Metallibacterium scheffleri]